MKIIKQKKLIELYKGYFDFKGMHYPKEARDALDFVVTEVGEIFDALKRTQPQWVRHNDRDTDLGMEISQAIMMLMIAADCEGIDIEAETYRWMDAKGYEAEFAAGRGYVLWAYPTNQSRRIHVWGKFNGVIQSACGLEMPADHTFGDKLPSGRTYPYSEPVCGMCSAVWSVKHARKPARKRLRLPFKNPWKRTR